MTVDFIFDDKENDLSHVCVECGNDDRLKGLVVCLECIEKLQP